MLYGKEQGPKRRFCGPPARSRGRTPGRAQLSKIPGAAPGTAALPAERRGACAGAQASGAPGGFSVGEQGERAEEGGGRYAARASPQAEGGRGSPAGRGPGAPFHAVASGGHSCPGNAAAARCRAAPVIQLV